ncbi:hypothetical protein H0H92_006093, partial [Tricholoma furcatifolium]
MARHHVFRPKSIPCRLPTCTQLFSTSGGATKHFRAKHAHFTPTTPTTHQHRAIPPSRTPTPAPEFPSSPPQHFFDSPPQSPRANPAPRPIPAGQNARIVVERHPLINGLPCDAEGNFLPDAAPPPPFVDPPPIDWAPYEDRSQFELADLLFRRTEMAADPLNDLMQIWAARHEEEGPPFASKHHLHDVIDSTDIAGVSWQSFTCRYNGAVEEADVEVAPWKLKEYAVWFRDPLAVMRNQLGNSDFTGEIDTAAKRVYDSEGKRQYQDFMSGEWANRRSDQIAEDPALHGATFCPVILGSDKTTVSVATGQTEYYPLYASNGLIQNNVRRAHRNGLTLIAFLAIPKAERAHKNSDEFRKFRRNIFHASLYYIFVTMQPFMSEPDLVRFGDGYFRRVIYGLGPYIADYPEQVLLACIVQGWCAR